MLQSARTGGLWLSVGILGSYFIGLLTPIIDVDAAQYAALSMEMCQRGDYLQITERGIDYLDKPPMLFWLACLSYQLAGFTAFAYKIPSVLFTLLGLWSTQRLGSLLHCQATGRLAMIVLASCLGVFWALNDVKTDALLMSAMAFALYQWLAYLKQPQWWNLIGAGVGMGIALLTKGPMGLVFPLVLVGFYLTANRQFRQIWKWQHLVPVAMALALCLPMAWGLYQQFDLHPEKEVLGRTGVSGLRFFFWEQSFGRITGENQYHNNTSFFYLFHSALLLLVPYSGLAVTGFFRQAWHWWHNKETEALSWGGSLLLLSALGLSSYQLPHYALVSLPLLAIVVAREWRFCQKNQPKWFQWYVRILLGIGVFTLLFCSWAFGLHWSLGIAAFILITGILFAWNFQIYGHALVMTGLLFGWLFNALALPTLVSYSESQQLNLLLESSGSEIAKEDIFFYQRQSRAIEFELQRRIPVLDANTLAVYHKIHPEFWFYMDENEREKLQGAGWKISREFHISQHGLSRLPFAFLNPKTRDSQLKKCYLLQLEGH